MQEKQQLIPFNITILGTLSIGKENFPEIYSLSKSSLCGKSLSDSNSNNFKNRSVVR